MSDCGFLGEAERSLLELMEETRHHGVKPYLMCPPQSALAGAAKKRDVPVIDWPLRRLSLPGGIAGSAELVGSVPGATLRTLGVLRRCKVDIVHTNSTTAQLQVGLAARLARTPCVWHWRDFHDLRRISRAIARTADMSIAVSQSVYDFALAQLGRTAPLMMIRSGLESPGALPEADVRCSLRSKWGVADSEILIGMMGQARPSKGHQVFIRAMDEVVAHRPDLRAILLHTQLDGEQERYLGELDSLAREARCHDRLTFAEPGDDVLAVLHALDIVVVPSLREPFGRVAVEAMLAERPVVASAVDSLAEIVGDAKTGLLVPPGDEKRLAEAVVLLADDPELRRRMGLAGRERALHRYSIARTAMEIVECYRRVRDRV